MHYEKAELILQQLMAGDRDLYLVRDSKDGRAVITDRPNEQQTVVGELKKAKRVPLLKTAVAILLCFLCPITVSSGVKAKSIHGIVCRESDDKDSEILEECLC